jgi:hypothetical protein
MRDRLAWHAWRSAVLVAAAVFIPLGLSGAPEVSAAEGGFKLEEAVDLGVEQYDRPNPHFDLDCTDCHETKPSYAKDTVTTVNFVNGDAGIVDLCYNCHDESDNLHPIHVDPSKASPPIRPPQDFPLERRGENKGTIVCITCHYIHTKTAGLKLMRGFPASSDPEDIANAQFMGRQDFCKACHGEDLGKKSPHKGREAGTQNCSFCHGTVPEEGEKVAFTRGIVTLCNFCHGALQNKHFLKLNPFADPDLTEEIAAAGLPVEEDGTYTCATCHNPHSSPGVPHLIRPAFKTLASKSKRVYPHGTDVLCLSCHETDPTEGEVTFRFTEGGVVNWTVLCNFCHGSGQIISDVHPLKPLTEGMEIPEDWPLDADGKLNCNTCHYMPFGGFPDEENPKHLRGGPYQNRNDICWTCHAPEDFRTTNPHADIAAGGGCTYCHSSQPREGKKVEFKGDIVLLCIRCHDDQYHPASHDHTGVPSEDWVESIPKDKFPLDRVGRITCATCHNPHSKEGEDRPRFRTGETVQQGMMICDNCHKGR